jgi:UDP-N-acetylglucosamine:LPS N-acetylglucosamine transferase
VVAFGFSDEVPLLMSASDIVISSSGDTCREARVVGRPLVLLDVVPGHGRENLQHEIELGDATVSMPVPSSIVAAVERMLDEVGGCGGVRQDRLAPVGSVDRWEREFRAALASVGFN